MDRAGDDPGGPEDPLTDHAADNRGDSEGDSKDAQQ
jgi:hypothetical protein